MTSEELENKKASFVAVVFGLDFAHSQLMLPWYLE